MQTSGSGDLVSRMKGAAMLDIATYEEIERDTSATSQAGIVVLLATIASGIGAIGQNGISGIIGGLISGLLGWIVFSFLVYLVGTKLIPAPTTDADSSQVMRLLGFAYTPNILAVIGFIPVLGAIAVLIAGIWSLVTSVVAVRQALEMTTLRAIATIVIAVIPAIIVVGILAAIFY